MHQNLVWMPAGIRFRLQVNIIFIFKQPVYVGGNVWVCVHTWSPCLTKSHAECQTSDHRTLMRTRSEPTQHSTPTPSTPQQSDQPQLLY